MSELKNNLNLHAFSSILFSYFTVSFYCTERLCSLCLVIVSKCYVTFSLPYLTLLNCMLSITFSSFVQFLDKVEVEMRTCEEPRPPNGPSPIAITAGQR